MRVGRIGNEKEQAQLESAFISELMEATSSLSSLWKELTLNLRDPKQRARHQSSTLPAKAPCRKTWLPLQISLSCTFTGDKNICASVLLQNIQTLRIQTLVYLPVTYLGTFIMMQTQTNINDH